MLIGARTTMMNAGPPSLPYDAEVEYLESTGTQVINLGDPVYAEWDVGLYPVEPTVSTNYSKYYCGSNNNGSRTNSVWAADSSAFNFTNYNREGLTVPCTLVAWHDIQVRAQTVTVDNSSYQYTLGAYGSRSGMNLFGSLYGTGYVGVKCRISYFKGYIDGNVAIDLIPVRVGTTGYLYDRANPTGGPLGNGLYPNSGTGDFVLGRDVNPISARSYVKDGLVAMWDGIENAGWGLHDSSSTTWVDLVGSNDLVLQNNAQFDSNSLVSADRDKLTAVSQTKFAFATVDVCAFWDSSRNSSGLICFGNSTDNSRMLSVMPGSIQIYNGTTIGLSSDVVRGTWAATYDDSNVAYRNGAVVSGTGRANNWGTRAGNFGLSGSSNYSNYNFVGNYYSVRLYSRALSAAEIATNHAVDVVRFGLEE